MTARVLIVPGMVEITDAAGPALTVATMVALVVMGGDVIGRIAGPEVGIGADACRARVPDLLSDYPELIAALQPMLPVCATSVRFTQLDAQDSSVGMPGQTCLRRECLVIQIGFLATQKGSAVVKTMPLLPKCINPAR